MTQNPTQATPNYAEHERKLPPRPIMMVMNTVMKTILRSPFHKGMSDRLMILNFTGRKSGKHYSTPVSYIETEPGKLASFTKAAWYKNMMGGAPVTVRVRGQVRKATATTVTDPLEAARGAQHWVDRYGTDQLQFIGLPNLDHKPTDEELAAIIESQQRVMIRTEFGA